MKRIIIFLICGTLLHDVRGDEGMWPLPLLYQRMERMRELGLQLQDYDIYHPDSSSIKDAVVIFGSGCTGEIISSRGLVLTNHHCGYSQIQSHSTLEHDYLTNGFWAFSPEEELPCPGLTVTFIEKIEDVTEDVMAELDKDTDPASMNYLSTNYLNGLAKVFADEIIWQQPGVSVEIRPFYGGNKYYMFTRKTYSDVRMVGAPPSSIGKFGADTDNWEWPRHTGDFSIFRVYADAKNEPANYAATNVPLRPKRWLTISLYGVNEDDFAMMIGFPGRTNQYYTSWEVKERQEIDNDIRIHFRELRQQAMLEEMLKDPAIKIQYSGKYASSANAYKNAIGSNWAIRKWQFEQSKQARQEKLYDWAKQNLRTEYIQALDAIEKMVNERADLRRRSWILNEAILGGIEFAGVSVNTDMVLDALKGKDKQKQEQALDRLKSAYERFANEDYEAEVDRKIAKIMLKEYMQWIPVEDQPDCFATIRKQYRGNVDRYVDALFATSIFGSTQNWNRFLAKPTIKAIQNDLLFQFVKSIQQERTYLTDTLAVFDSGYAHAHRTYVKGLLETEKDQVLFPDANSSLRATYGQIKGYQPRDAVYYTYQTTLEGVMEKENPSDWEFVVPSHLKALYDTKDYGRYSLDGNRMPVCFTATTHSTGGNSGSPVINAKGELIGINFDRNWEGVGGDIQYLPDYQRSIIVDIRYILFIIDKYAGARYLIQEMETNI